MEKRVSAKSNFIYNALFQITGILVPLVTTPYLSRILHAEGIGKYSFAYSVAYYFYIFIRLGLHSYGNRTIAYVRDDKEKLEKTFSAIYTFQFLSGVFMLLIYLLYSRLFSPDKKLALIFGMIVVAGSIDFTWLLYGLEEFKATSLRDIAVKIITALCIFLFVKNEDDVWKYALIYSVGFLISQIIVLPLVAKRVRFVMPTVKEVLAHIKPNFVLFLPTIAVSIYKTMDKIMLGAMSNDAELGYYHSCENIIKVPLALITALGTVMLPRISNMLASGETDDEIKKIFSKSISFVMFVTSLICFGMMSVADMFVPIFYGVGFEKCIFLFWVILPSCIFVAFANVIRTQYLLPRKMDRLFIISLFSGAAVNLLANLILIPRYASIGAAIGTTLAEIVVCVVQGIFVFEEASIGKNIINSVSFVIGGIAMFLVFRGFTVNGESDIFRLLLKIAFAGAFYLVVVGIWGLIGKRFRKN